jgi:hypothetical protein
LAQIAVGSLMTIDAQLFEAVKVHAFTRKDGSQGVLIDWRSNCPVCGKEFLTTSSATGATPTRRCRDHRALSKSVAGSRKRMTVRILPFGIKAGTGDQPATGQNSAL